jgi:hypothetical protein
MKVYDIEGDRMYIYLRTFRKLGWNDANVTNFRAQIEGIIGSGRFHSTEQYPSFYLYDLDSVEKLEKMKAELTQAVVELRTHKANPSA